MTPFERWQIEKYGNVLPDQPSPLDHDEQQLADREKEAERVNDYHEREMDEHFNH